MSHQLTVWLLVTLLVGTAPIVSAQNANPVPLSDKGTQGRTACPGDIITQKNVRTMLALFDAVEQHDDVRERQMEQPDVKFHWPTSLYGKKAGFTWSETWLLLQPTPAERRMDPRVVAANDDEVVVQFHQRGVSHTGERYDGEVLGLYQFREGKLARAQMFYFDTAVVSRFLTKALRPELRRRARAVFDRLESLPQQRGALLGRTYEDLWRMVPNERTVALDSEKLKHEFSFDERDVLMQLLDLTIGSPERHAKN